jgi:hypothetical protein
MSEGEKRGSELLPQQKIMRFTINNPRHKKSEGKWKDGKIDRFQ